MNNFLFNFILSAILCLSLITEVNAETSNWKIRDLGTLSNYSDAHIKELNDQGQALLVAKPQNSKKEEFKWLLFTPDIGLQTIPDPVPDYWAPNQWQRVNVLGVVAGTMQANTGQLNNNLFLTTWSPRSGATRHRLPVTKEHPSSGFIARCRMSDQIIISTYTDAKLGGSKDARVFSLVNGSLNELTPKLNELASHYGYSTGDWIIASVNSAGTLLGRFDYYQANPFRKGQLSVVGSKYFLFNGDTLILIDFPEELLSFYNRNSSFFDLAHIFLDAQGRVMFDSFVISRRCWENWEWENGKGLRPLDQTRCLDIEGNHAKARALCLMDDGALLLTVQGSEDCNGYFIQRGTERLRLALDGDRQPLEGTDSNFEGLKIIYHLLYKTWPLHDEGTIGEFIGNTRNQIFFLGTFYGERHPFFIEPQ